MQQLAAAIRQDIDRLVDGYDAGLRHMPGYDHLPEELRRDLECRILSLIAQCMDIGDYAALVQYVQERAVQWDALGLPLAWFQHALLVPEEILTPLITSVDAGNFLWQALNRSQSAVWQMVADRAHQTEERFRTVADYTYGWETWLSPEGRFIYVSPACERISGYVATEFVENPSLFAAIAHPDDRAQVETHLHEHASTAETVPLEFRIITKQGQVRWINHVCRAVYDTAGKWQGRRGSNNDVTERKQAEQALRESEENYHKAIAAANAVPYYIDYQIERYRFIGDGVEDFTGYLPQEMTPDLLGQMIQETIVTGASSGLPRAEAIQQARAGEALQWNADYHLVDRYGMAHWLSDSSVQVLDEQSKPIGAIGILQDITIRKQTETQLAHIVEKQQQLTKHLRAAIEATDELMRAPDLDTLYRRAVELAREKLGVERCGLFVVDPTHQFMLGTYGTDDQGGTIDEHAVREPVDRHQTMYLSEDQLWVVQEAPQRQWIEGKEVIVGTGWVGGTAIRSAAGPIGVLYNDATISHAPVDPGLQEALAVYCSMLGSIIESKRLDTQIRDSLTHRNIQVQTSVEVAQHIAAAPELGELLHRVVTLVKERFNYYHAQLFRYAPATDAVELITGYGEVGQKMLAAGHRLAMGRGVVGTAAATGQSILATDVTRDLDWRPNPNLPDTKGELAVPIKLGTSDVESQLHALQYFAAGGYDGYIVSAVDPEAAAQVTRESLWHGKPVVATSVSLGQDNQTAIIKSVEHDTGYLLGVEAGTWAKQHLPDGQLVKIGVLTCRTLSNVVERERGMIDGLQSVIGERLTVVVSESAMEPKEAAYLTEGWLRAYPDLSMIVAYNDATALGAYQAAHSAGRHDPDQFFIGGIDGVPEALDAIQQGSIYQATVNQPPEIMGIMAVRTLVAAIKGLAVKPIYALHCQPVNRTNVAEFSGPARAAAIMAHQDIIPTEALAGLDLAGLRLGLSVLTLANPFFATLAASAQQEAQRLGVQLVINDPSRILGVLDVQSDQANTLTDDDRLLLEGLCGQIAIAIESKRLVDSAQQSERLMRTLIDTIPGHIYAKDLDGRLILANLTEAQLHGVDTPEILIGKSDFDFYPRELAEQYWASEQPILRDGIPLLNHEEPNLDAAGHHFWSSTTKVPLRNNQGEVIGLVGMTTDITERKQAEDERERLLQEQERRTVQLQTASEVSRAASSILNLDALLPQAAELIRTRFNLYYVGIFLLDETERWAVLRAGTGEAGQHMVANSHKLKIGGNSMISQCVVTQRARIALDVGEEAERFDNPLLPRTRSEMALPLVSHGRITGAATIQSDQPEAFSADDITVLQSMIDQISNAVENARLYQQAQAALQEVDAINRRLTGEAWDTYLHQRSGGDVIWLADDDAAAPTALPEMDEPLTAGEITLETDPADDNEVIVTAPILLRGQPIGALRLRTPLNEWNDDTKLMLADIAGHIAQAVENARLVEQTQRSAQRERTINEINARVRQSVDLDAILRTAVNELGQSLKAARVMARVGTTATDAAAVSDGRGKTNE